MRKLNVTPEEMKAVCGRMPACRAADKLSLTISQFYFLAQRYSITTAFTYKHWSEKDDEQLISLVHSGHMQKPISEIMGRSFGSVRSRVTHLRKIKRIQ